MTRRAARIQAARLFRPMTPRAVAAFSLNEAASLRRMVASARRFRDCDALQLRDESAAMEKARERVRIATDFRTGRRA